MFNYVMKDSEELEFIQVADVEELPVGERLFFDIDGEPIVIIHLENKYFAIADVCSHDGGPIGEGEIEGFKIRCPRHGALFDIRDGRVLALPAVVDIPAYPVRIVDGKIELGLPLNK